MTAPAVDRASVPRSWSTSTSYASMADSHISLLTAIARHRERRVDQLDSGSERSTSRRAELAVAAERARAQVTAAAARRRLPRGR